MAPVFIITIDTEGDNIWAHPHPVTTENARHLPRFQELCERYGFAPSYLVDYEMAIDPIFNSVPEAGRRLLIADLDLEHGVEGVALGYRFDMVVRGPRATPMGV